MSNSQDKFDELFSSDDKSSWREKVAYRKENKEWLDLSFEVAMRFLEEIENQKINQNQQPSISTSDDHFARQRVKMEMREKMWKIIDDM